MMHFTNQTGEVKAWIKRERGPNEIVKVVGNTEIGGVVSYELFTAHTEQPDYFGRILFDTQGYWIYDGDILTISEQEQVAKFIIKYVDTQQRTLERDE